MGGLSWLDIDVESRYSATYYQQSAYPTIKRNSDVSNNYIMYKNSGSAAWYDRTTVPVGYYPTQLLTAAPLARTALLSVNWPNKQVAADVFTSVYEADGTTLAGNQHIVMPGQIGRFDFKMAASANITQQMLREYFQPVIATSPHPEMGGLSWLDVTIQDATNVAQFNTQSAIPPASKGQSVPVFIQYKNVGISRWYDDTSVPQGLSPIHFAANNPINRSSIFSYGWPSAGRPSVNFTTVYESDGITLASNQHVVEPGQIAKFTFNITPPWTLSAGKYREYFQLVAEGASSWSVTSSLAWFDVTVSP
jgi:hypothetical protein